MQKQHIRLSDSDRKALQVLLNKGELKARSYRRAQGLLFLDDGHSHESASRLLGVSATSIKNWAKRYRESGLELLRDQPRSGRPSLFDSLDHGKVTALACSDPPEGYSRWSLRLLSDRLVALEVEMSHTEVGKVLKKTNFSLTESANGAYEK